MFTDIADLASWRWQSRLLKQRTKGRCIGQPQPDQFFPSLPSASPFAYLASELLQEIIRHLSPSAKISLSYTCRFFRYLVYDTGYYIETLFTATPPNDLEKGNLHLLLDRDRLLRFPYQSKTHFYCHSCHTNHRAKFFSPEALRAPPGGRDCRGRGVDSCFAAT